MAENIQRSRGRPPGYKFDRGGTPTEFGPFIGIVVNNIDPTRSGRLQVWISQFGATNADGTPNLDAKDTWRTVSYIPPFYGVTPHTGTNQGAGTFTGNQQSYGMWFTPPDLYTQVICFFVGGDPNQGYYIGCIPDQGINHMVPAIGASTKYTLQNGPQDAYFAGARQLPVTEINDENPKFYEDPRFFTLTKPVHSYVAGIMMQQGLIKDVVRGPITSNSQRESPSAVFGISTPGRAIYQGGLNERDIRAQLERGDLRPQDVEVIARRGGHSIVLDDGDLEGQDNLVRIRTAKGHQITMSDDGDCFYIIHANGQTWLEFGKQGTVDVFSTNSVNVRTQGTINLHADKDINMYAGGSINAKSKMIKIEAEANLDLTGTAKLTAYSKNSVGIKSDGSLNLKSSSGAWDGGGSLNLLAGCINLNSGGSATVETPANLKDVSLADTVFKTNIGWTVEYGKLKTIVTRAPTHEPYPYHNQGVDASISFSSDSAADLNKAAATTLDKLKNTPVQNGVQAADVLDQPPAELSIGSMEPEQVTAVLAQTAKDVGQDYDVVSADKGIGKYGLSADQLEAAGYLKPGTVQTFLQDPTNLTTVLNSPSVWTGKSDVMRLDNLLADPGLQSLTQNEIMLANLEGLKQAGLVTGREAPADLAPFVQVASKLGVDDTISWANGTLSGNFSATADALAKNAQFAVNFVDQQSITSAISPISVGSFTNTVDRSEVDSVVEEVIGNPKIPSPIYTDSNEMVETFVEETRTTDTAVTEPTVEQKITRLENEIFSLEGRIRFLARRGRDTTDLRQQLTDLQGQLAGLK